jgi:hypothetical protein
MSDAIAAALPYAVAALLAGPAVLVVFALIIATSRTPEASAWAFVAGGALLVTIAAVLYALLILTGSDPSSDFAAVFGILLGIAFIAFGLAPFREHETPEKRQPQRARIESVARGSLRTPVIAGVAVRRSPRTPLSSTAVP